MAQPLHILFFPLMAPGHLIPMLDIANLLTTLHNTTSTLLTTPANASLLRPYLQRHPAIQLGLIPFPSSATTGLPADCENLASVPSPELEPNFFHAVAMLQEPFNLFVEQLRPDCIVADGFLPWTHDMAAELGIPRIVFHGTSFFARCAFDSLDRFGISPDESGLFVIPGLPHQIPMHTSQLPSFGELPMFFLEMFGKMKETEPKSYGVIVNSFHELEPEYAQHYTEVVGRKAWCVGPASLCNRDLEDLLARGGESQVDYDACLDWVNGRTERSVLYVSFGSLSLFSHAQLNEIAEALVKCGHPFVWVVGKGHDLWTPPGDGIELQEKGLVVRGWVPQMALLDHVAVGGFLTHCGWNSCLEGICAGLPLVTWPLFAEQFYNERLIVDVLKVGVGVGANKYSVKQEERPVIEAEKIVAAIREVMGDGEEAEERRGWLRELSEMAKRAVEVGGSSYEDTSYLIKELIKKRDNV